MQSAEENSLSGLQFQDLLPGFKYYIFLVPYDCSRRQMISVCGTTLGMSCHLV